MARAEPDQLSSFDRDLVVRFTQLVRAAHDGDWATFVGSHVALCKLGWDIGVPRAVLKALQKHTKKRQREVARSNRKYSRPRAKGKAVKT
jgi:hypothetical protein